jgi:hypothetical protein
LNIVGKSYNNSQEKKPKEGLRENIYDVLIVSEDGDFKVDESQYEEGDKRPQLRNYAPRSNREVCAPPL